MVKKRTLVNSLLVVLIVLTGMGVGFGLSKMAAARRKASAEAALMSQTARTVDNRSLQERAKQERHYVSDQGPSRIGAYTDLAGLTKNSSAVVVGIPQDNASALSPDGKSITLDYKVQVMYVYKGALRPGRTITVSLPGGKVAFNDGSTAEVRTPWFRKMSNGKAYVLFLNVTSRPNVFVTTGEAQGLFEIPMTIHDRMIVQTHTGLPTDPMRKYQNADARDFLRELRRVTGKPLRKV